MEEEEEEEEEEKEHFSKFGNIQRKLKYQVLHTFQLMLTNLEFSLM